MQDSTKSEESCYPDLNHSDKQLDSISGLSKSFWLIAFFLCNLFPTPCHHFVLLFPAEVLYFLPGFFFLDFDPISPNVVAPWVVNRATVWEQERRWQGGEGCPQALLLVAYSLANEWCFRDEPLSPQLNGTRQSWDGCSVAGTISQFASHFCFWSGPRWELKNLTVASWSK